MVAPLAILDSDVLFGVISMDVMMSLGVAAIYEPHWSEEILFASERNTLRARPDSGAAFKTEMLRACSVGFSWLRYCGFDFRSPRRSPHA